MTDLDYYRDAYKSEFDATVVEVTADGAAVLRRRVIADPLRSL